MEFKKLSKEQIAEASDLSLEIQSINGMIKLGGYLETLPLQGKIQTMQGVVNSTIDKQTVGVSYTGNFPWNGLEKYISNVYAYAGERKGGKGIALEVFVIGEYFSITMMQPGKNPEFAEKMIRIFADRGISCRLVHEEAYQLSDYQLPVRE